MFNLEAIHFGRFNGNCLGAESKTWEAIVLRRGTDNDYGTADKRFSGDFVPLADFRVQKTVISIVFLIINHVKLETGDWKGRKYAIYLEYFSPLRRNINHSVQF
ncbi:hypothetical protein K0M31_020070 [Melipona bicolor]|uniref:Uncharacterized protein n=1 Tax=Melipona bicolor TaxID=60889 RepID=A0AA40G0S4_9HYME|nr:hypothetical protein K0M31_020070 [Melipona bicolor]